MKYMGNCYNDALKFERVFKLKDKKKGQKFKGTKIVHSRLYFEALIV